MKRAVNYLKKEINRLNREEGDKAEEQDDEEEISLAQ